MKYEDAYRRMTMCGSEDRAAVLVEIAREVEGAGMLRELLIEFWTMIEAWGGSTIRGEMFEILKRVGYVSDTDERPPHGSFAGVEGVLTIYRGNAGEDPLAGHAWTLSAEVGQLFACLPFTMRGAFLGLCRDGSFGEIREGAVATVWRARVLEREVLGYFTGRGEQEIVVDPATLMLVEPFQRAEVQ